MLTHTELKILSCVCVLKIVFTICKDISVDLSDVNYKQKLNWLDIFC